MIKLYYCKIANFGDAMNPYLIERITGKKCVFAGKSKAELCGVGSVLSNFIRKPIISVVKSYLAPKINVWSSGFIMDQDYADYFQTRKMNFLALRGHLSKDLAEKIIGKKLDITLGDGGLLFDLMLDKKPAKKYALGIIPHVDDFDNPIFVEMSNKFKNSKIIDFSLPPLEVMEEIASCEMIVSTAMHGLIAADSLGIPNKWIEVSDKVLGGGFKFKDYYSVFDIKNPRPIRLDSADDISLLSLNKISDEYEINKKNVEEIKKNLYESLKNF